MKILVLTGAGLSAESGLPTFRATGGLWQGNRIDQVATPDAFAVNPGLVLDFYNDRREAINKAEPNAAHRALARLQAADRHKVILVTQNIDDLHERAGSSKVVHMHGSIFAARCNACGVGWSASYAMDPEDTCPHCVEMAVRPDIVWFGEVPKEMALIERALSKADLFVAIGTSGSVYPAAGFARKAKAWGAATLEINIAASETSHVFDEIYRGSATTMVPVWVEKMLR